MKRLTTLFVLGALLCMLPQTSSAMDEPVERPTSERLLDRLNGSWRLIHLVRRGQTRPMPLRIVLRIDSRAMTWRMTYASTSKNLLAGNFDLQGSRMVLNRTTRRKPIILHVMFNAANQLVLRQNSRGEVVIAVRMD